MNDHPCFVLNVSDADLKWKTSDPNDWDLSVCDLTGQEKILGHKKIDGSIFKILQDADGRVIAITKV